MAPASIAEFLARRQNYNDTYYCTTYGRCYSNWDRWGRWVALAVIIIVVVIAAFLLACLTNRRRRRRGMTPMYGTGWFAGKPPQGQHYGNTNYYPNQPYNGGGPAPPYSPPIGNQATGNTFNSNDGYYGNHGQHGYGYNGQQSGGIELQPPQNSYHPQRGGDPVYEAPYGAPPGKGDGIVR